MGYPAWSRPCPDELLSSWLARVAVHGGADPLSLTASIWPRWRVWTTDVDRGLSVSNAQALARWMQCGEDEVHNTTLQSYTARIHGIQRHYPSFIPWLLTRGCRNRSHFAGQPYCPACLQGDLQPYYRRLWRLAFVVGCERHGIRLLDRCVKCQALVTPHLCVAGSPGIGRCAACSAPLSMAGHLRVQEKAMQFQQMAMNVLLEGESSWWGAAIPSATWFSWVRRMLAPRRCPISADQIGALRMTNLPIEMEDVAEREARFCALMDLLETQPNRVRTISARQNAQRKLRTSLRDSQSMPLATRQSSQAIDENMVRVKWTRWLRKNRMW